MTDPVRIPYTRQEVAVLRGVLRIVTVQRLQEVVSSGRTFTKEQVSDNRMLTDVLRFMDIWHMHDRLLQNFMENTPGSATGDEVAINMHADPIEFYRELLAIPLNLLPGVADDTFNKMIEICRANQAPLLEKLNQAVAQAQRVPVPINVFRAPQGKN